MTKDDWIMKLAERLYICFEILQRHAERRTKRELPNEVWALRRVDGGLVPPIDCDTGVFMAYPSKDLAERGKTRQEAMYEFEGGELTVVQLK